MFEIKKNKKRIMICGTGSGCELAPKESSSTVYALNDYIHKERYGIQPDKLFILDVLDEKPLIVAGINNLGEVIAKINSLKCPLIAPFRYEEIPLSEPFPLKECAEKFGQPYFSNTIGYMVAFALLEFLKLADKETDEVFKTWQNVNSIELNETQSKSLKGVVGKLRQLKGFSIELFGINQASSSEYFYEKAGAEYWLGIANGLGVDITIHGDKSEVLSNKKRFGGNLLYGYNQTYSQIRMAEEKFGEQIIKKLLTPSKPSSRNIRKIN